MYQTNVNVRLLGKNQWMEYRRVLRRCRQPLTERAKSGNILLVFDHIGIRQNRQQRKPAG
jgi:hypothetical protein